MVFCKGGLISLRPLTSVKKTLHSSVPPANVSAFCGTELLVCWIPKKRGTWMHHKYLLIQFSSPVPFSVLPNSSGDGGSVFYLFSCLFFFGGCWFFFILVWVSGFALSRFVVCLFVCLLV